MEELQIKKWKDEKDGSYASGYIFKRDGNKKLHIMFLNNLDLYFTLSEFGDDLTFIIGKDYYEVYEIFDELYKNILGGVILSTESEIELERNREIAKSTGLVIDHQIVWRSDNYPFRTAPYFILKKEGEVYILDFKKPDICDSLFDDISVRVRNSGSRYMWYNIPFMKAFNNLDDIDLENRQIHIEEYLNEERLNKSKTLTKTNNKE